MGGDSHLAKDLARETLGRMCRKWGRCRRIENPFGYAQAEDTALALKVSPSAVRARTFRALARIRDLLGADSIEFSES